MDLDASALATEMVSDASAEKSSSAVHTQDAVSSIETASDIVTAASRQGTAREGKRQQAGSQPPAKVSRSSLMFSGTALTSEAIARALGTQQEVRQTIESKFDLHAFPTRISTANRSQLTLL